MGFGHGKVILLGEHSVVYGNPAIASSLSMGVHAEAQASDGEASLSVEPWHVRVPSEASDNPQLAKAWQALLAAYPQQEGLCVHAESNLPGGAGLGCSAAMGVALVQALDEWHGITRSPESQVEVSLIWERVFHGNPSGIDNTMAVLGGTARYCREQPLQTLEVGQPLSLVIAHSGVFSSTQAMVDKVAQQRQQQLAAVDALFARISQLVKDAQKALSDGDVQSLGEMMEANHAYLRELGVSADPLDDLCERARQAEAWGAKLTGAGGGGCMIALAREPDHAQSLVQHLRPLAAQVFSTEVSASAVAS